MLRLVLLLILITSYVPDFAQNSKIDSLNKLLQKHLTEDTTRLNLLNNLSISYSPLDPDKGIDIANNAIVLATQFKNYSKLGLAHTNKAVLLNDKTEFEKSLKELNAAVSSYKKANDLDGEGKAHFRSGRAYYNMGMYKDAITQIQKAIPIFKKTGDKIKEANCFNSIGSNYLKSSDYPKALENFLHAITLYEQVKDTVSLAMALSNVALVNKYLNSNDKALAYYQKSLSTYHALGSKKEEAQILNKIGDVYDNTNNSNKALEYYRLSYSINEKENFVEGLASNYANMGIAYITINAYDSAIQSLQLSLPLLKALKDKNNEAVVLANLGIAFSKAPPYVLFKNGLTPSAAYIKATDLLSRALAIKTEDEDVYGQAMCWQALAELYEKRKDYRNAFRAQAKLTLLKDSIFNDEKSEEITRMEIQYEQEKKDAILNAQHTAEINQQRSTRNFAIAGAGIILFASLLLFISYKRRRDANAKRVEAETKAMMANTEMKVLRLQMNPHFIFNSLNSISDYISKNDIKNADYYLSKFAKLMRGTLENSEEKEIPLADELKMIEVYIQLEAMRLGNKFSYEIKVDEGIDVNTTMVPPLILQPFVENSIWHGLAKKEGEGKIIIEVTKENTMLNCVVEDNGVGRDASAKNMGKKSLGMKITQDRIDLLNKFKNTNASVHLVDLQQGTRAEVKLPYETEE